MSEVGKLMRKIRGKDSLRTAGEKTGISHNYLSILEKGIDPRTGSPIKPSPDTLRAFAKGYPTVTYEELMKVAGYIDEDEIGNKKYNDDETTIRLLEEEAAKLGLSPSDPVFKKMLADAFELLRIARGKDLK